MVCCYWPLPNSQNIWPSDSQSIMKWSPLCLAPKHLALGCHCAIQLDLEPEAEIWRLCTRPQFSVNNLTTISWWVSASGILAPQELTSIQSQKILKGLCIFLSVASPLLWSNIIRGLGEEKQSTLGTVQQSSRGPHLPSIKGLPLQELA